MRFMIDVALHQDGGPVSLKDVAARQELSEKYLWQVLAPLKAAGLVSSVRGAGGGYVLARPAREITLRDIVGTLEGEDLVMGCAGDPGACGRSGECVARDVWRDLAARIAEWLEAITLEELVEKQKANEQVAVPTYSI